MVDWLQKQIPPRFHTSFKDLLPARIRLRHDPDAFLIGIRPDLGNLPLAL